ncbi:MAG: hypothetical protein AAGA96_06965 [Verrucomicrobiota bacterium]
MTPRIHLLLLAGVLSALTGCNKETEERLDRLEAELREIRSDTRDEVAQLKTRVISAESTVGYTQDGRSFADRVSFVEQSIEALRSLGSNENQTVFLRAAMKGHSLLPTDHGTFLVRLEDLDIDIANGGFFVHIAVGNPFGFAVNQFTLQGNYGGGTPELREGESYSLSNPAIRAWQESLKPFEIRVNKTLAPLSWTSFDIKLPADSREELEVVSFAMIVENADVTAEGISSGSEAGQIAHLRLGADVSSIMRTEYGAFLIRFVEVEESDVGTRALLEIGNPYGFIIEECRLSGEFGPAIPKRAADESMDTYREKMTEWTATLQPFDAMISPKLSGLRTSKATILIPAPADQVQFLRCRLVIEAISLPEATGG